MAKHLPYIDPADLEALVPTQDRSWAVDYRHHESLAHRIFMFGVWPLAIVTFVLLAWVR